jgi:2-polyprenyl-3-methyl-5-hydroxy-6-metoxy-1,4-benzoquinol methylase
MMFGTREMFPYLKCANCGGLQIEKIPKDLERHYPANYNCWAAPLSRPRSGVLRRLRRTVVSRVIDHQLGSRSVTASVAYRLARKRRRLPLWMEQTDLWQQCGLTRKSAILDVGAGSGTNLALLAQLGFTNLLGIDPFFDSTVLPSDQRIRIRKINVSGLAKETSAAGANARFKLIMFHHSLEHVPDPASDLVTAKTLLEPNGWMLIRVPVAGTLASQRYGADWVQLDAPRHLCLFTTRSMEALAARVGLVIEKIVFDSTAFQFWGSEQYRRNIPLDDVRSVVHAPPNGPFAAAEMQEWEQRAEYLNQTGQGDQAIFYMRRNIG